MDAKLVVGVGNIYANEALFLSGITPHKLAGRLTKAKQTIFHEKYQFKIIAADQRRIIQVKMTLPKDNEWMSEFWMSEWVNEWILNEWMSEFWMTNKFKSYECVKY